MSEKEEIRYMKARLIRLASEKWDRTIEEVIELFSDNNVLPYISAGYGIFHVEGDNAVLEDIEEYLSCKGVRFDG